MESIQTPVEYKRDYTLDYVLGSIREPINADRILWIKAIAEFMPQEEALRFIKNRFYPCLFISQSRMVKVFILLNQMIETREDINVRDFETLLNAIPKLRSSDPKENERLNLIKAKVIDDILVPLSIKAAKKGELDGDTLVITTKLILQYLPNTGYTFDDFVERVLKARKGIITPSIIENLTNEQLEELKLKEFEETEQYLANHSAA